MEKGKFNMWNRVTAWIVFIIAAFTYLSTIEPTASFWDCGEFIASSYKLEVGHPPGNPVFQLIARFFTIFTGPEHAAVAVNAMSALCSALTIFFLYLTIVFFAKRLVRPSADGRYGTAAALAIFGSGAVGALIYCFSDTFWFSAVEGEVYAMSSLFTAIVLWAMTKWYEQEDRRFANRWIVFIAFIIGLSIGVHLLNLLTIPALVFLYYYKMKEDGSYSFKQFIGIFALSAALVALILYGIIPLLPKAAAYFDLAFVNWFGLPYNSGAVFFMALVFVLCFWGLFRSLKRNKVFLNTALLCLTSIIIGFSIFSIVIIRSSVKTPTNEYQPDNPFTLVRYLAREQYGSAPLLYGQYYGAPYDIKTPKYWAPMDGKYVRSSAPIEPEYAPEGKMLFPRMWSNTSNSYIQFYQSYTEGKGTRVRGTEYKKPTFGANMRYFFDYQFNWMYCRYFMWNFVGRQNDIHSPAPGDIFHGNWESGIGFIDNMRLGDQTDAPDSLKHNKGKNHYFFLPLLLGLIGLFFQWNRDRRGCWIVFLTFFMTGIAILIFLNQTPYQVRERDYAYAGSFYAFSIWTGFAVAALYEQAARVIKGGNKTAAAAAVSLLCLGVPALMAEENWDDHDRSNRYTAPELARNYLNSVGHDGILITHGDNDTFPLWYVQEVEGVRTDVRIVNTSLLGTDWHIDQMKYACNESSPLPLTVPQSQYLYGTNEYVFIVDDNGGPMPIKQVMDTFKDTRYRIELNSGRKADFICSRKITVPVNKENVIKYGILDESFKDRILDEIVLEIPESTEALTKPELFMLDLLSNYEWDRPINMLSLGGDLNIGLDKYLMYNGFSSKLVPIENSVGEINVGIVDTEELYRNMTETFKWDAFARTDYFADYQNCYTFLGVLSQRNIFVSSAFAFMKAGRNDRAIEMLDKCRATINEEMYPLDCIPLKLSGNDYFVYQMVSLYYLLGEPEKAKDLAVKFCDELLTSARFYLEFYDIADREFDLCSQYLIAVTEEMKRNGDEELASKITGSLNAMITAANEQIKANAGA